MGRFIFVSFGLLVVFLSLSGTAADCPPDWSPNQGHCYRVFNEPQNWANAERACRQEAEGGHLASIQSGEESAFVARLASKSAQDMPVWIGLNCTSMVIRRCNWQWTDGSPFGYQSWNQGPPNVSWMKLCVELIPSAYRFWNNQMCGVRQHFVCKFKPQV